MLSSKICKAYFLANLAGCFCKTKTFHRQSNEAEHARHRDSEMLICETN